MLAGNFKQEITDKENPKDQSELLASDGSSLFIVNAANPMLMRSRKATM
jgi:hypothetical protein